MLKGKEGSIVVLDPQSGEVLALASYPTFDPNKFINRFTAEEWLALVRSPEYPLENRTIRGLYSPGSVFKPVMAVGALEDFRIQALLDELDRPFWPSNAAHFHKNELHDMWHVFARPY